MKKRTGDPWIAASDYGALLPQDTHDRGSGQAAWHPARLTHLTTIGESLHAPVCAGLEEARAGATASARAS